MILQVEIPYTGAHTVFESDAESCVETEDMESDVQSQPKVGKHTVFESDAEPPSPALSGMYSEQNGEGYQENTDADYQDLMDDDDWIYDYFYGTWYYAWNVGGGGDSW